MAELKRMKEAARAETAARLARGEPATWTVTIDRALLEQATVSEVVRIVGSLICSSLTELAAGGCRTFSLTTSGLVADEGFQMAFEGRP